MAACALIVELELKPGAKSELLPILMEHAAKTRAEEPGCRQFDVLAPDDDDSRILVVEVYDDREAYDAHREGPRMPAVGAAMQPFIAARKRTVCAIM